MGTDYLYKVVSGFMPEKKLLGYQVTRKARGKGIRTSGYPDIHYLMTWCADILIILFTCAHLVVFYLALICGSIFPAIC